MSYDPTFELDRPDRDDDDGDPPPRGTPVDGETRQFTVTTIERVSLGRFCLPCEDETLWCGLWTAWTLYGPVGDLPVGETRALTVPRVVSATWYGSAWRVSDVAT